MPSAYHLPLDEARRVTLEQLRDHGPKAYLRERAAALLAVARGASIRTAARVAGLKPHKAETVCRWVARYQTEGVVGLWIRKGRGRKPASFPAGHRAGAGGGRRRGAARPGAGRVPRTGALVARRGAPGGALAGRARAEHRLADAAAR